MTCDARSGDWLTAGLRPSGPSRGSRTCPSRGGGSSPHPFPLCHPLILPNLFLSSLSSRLTGTAL